MNLEYHGDVCCWIYEMKYISLWTKEVHQILSIDKLYQRCINYIWYHISYTKDSSFYQITKLNCRSIFPYSSDVEKILSDGQNSERFNIHYSWLHTSLHDTKKCNEKCILNAEAKDWLLLFMYMKKSSALVHLWKTDSND